MENQRQKSPQKEIKDKNNEFVFKLLRKGPLPDYPKCTPSKYGKEVALFINIAEAKPERAPALKELEDEFIECGTTVPKGLLHILYHHGTLRKDVYRSLWASLMFVAKLPTGGKRTLVYPKVLREVVRERFGGDPSSGAYDEQYEEEETAYHVTMADLVSAKWRAPPKSCKLCN